MREIKFRSWLKKDQRMLTKFVMDSPAVVESETHVLMQYTGLKDKHGVEIYEGDVVTGLREGGWHGGYDRVRAKVYFSDTTLSYAVDGMGGGYLHNIEDVEVIGNIYENPEITQ